MHAVCSILVASCLLGGTFSGEPSSAPSNSETYEVRSCAPITANSGEPMGLCPMLRDRGLIGTSIDSNDADPNYVLELVRALNPEEWQYEGRELYMLDEEQLYVRAPAALQESTARFLAFLEGSMAKPTQIVVDIVTLASGADDPSIGAVIPAGDVQRVVNAAKQGGTHRSFTLSMLPGAIAQAKATRVMTLVTDYDVEIAQASTTYDPIVEEIEIGAWVRARISPAQGGSWLALVASDGATLGDVETRDTRMQGTIANDNGTHASPGPRGRQDVLVAERSFVLNGFLPDGKALVLRTSIEGAQGRSTEFLIVRHEGSSAPLSYRLPEDVRKLVARPNMLLLRGDATSLPMAVAGGSSIESTAETPAWWWRRAEGQASLSASIVRGADDRLMDAMRDPEGRRDVSTSGPWVVVSEPPPEPGTDVPQREDPLVTLTRTAPKPRVFVLSVAVKRGATSEAVAARCVVPIRAGAQSVVVLGKEHLVLQDMDVEVAQSASVADPIVGASFEGLRVQATPRVTNSGGVVLDLQVHGRVRRGSARSFDPSSPGLSMLDQEDDDRVDVIDSLRFPRGDGSPRRVVLGNSGSSSDALTIEVELAEPR